MANSYVETKSKCDIVVEKILKQIVEKKYKVGDKLPNESMLCEEFGVSRITVREAIKRLSMLGLVSAQQGRGTFVTQEDFGTQVLPVVAPVLLEGATAKQVYEARLYMESGNARLAAKNRTQKDIDKMNAICDQMNHIMEHFDAEEYGRLDKLFHEAIADASQNPVLKGISRAFEKIFSFYISKVTEEILKETTETHWDIVKYIELQDEHMAAYAMENHCKRVVLRASDE